MALGHASQFAEFEISQPLHTDPDSGSDHGQHQAHRTTGGPQQKQTEKRKDSRNAIEHDYDLAVRQTMLQQFVVDVLAIGGENGTAADPAAQNGQRGFQDRQSERNDGDGDGDDGG
jgi:hypothetical protein